MRFTLPCIVALAKPRKDCVSLEKVDTDTVHTSQAVKLKPKPANATQVLTSKSYTCD